MARGHIKLALAIVMVAPPLAITSLLQLLSGNWEWAITTTIIVATAVTLSGWYLEGLGQLEPTRIEAHACDEADVHVAGYFVAYALVVPGTVGETLYAIATLTVLALLIAPVLAFTNIVYFQPIVWIRGYRYYELKNEDGTNVYLVSRTRPALRTPIRVVQVADAIFAESK